MHYGGDYNPEQWDEPVWLDDVQLMREAGVTMVRVGVFAWSRIQPAEGVFDWEWLDRVLDLLHENGVQVALATGTASPPPWATTQYPEMLPADQDGTVFHHGSRQAYAPSSPVYRRLATELLTALVERYKDHPAVAMWVANNEYGCHLHYDYSDNAAVAFRAWLQSKYGDIDALNAAWGTMFWSQRYTAFEQIQPMRKAPYSLNPAGLLDFRRFTSDMLLELFTMERDIIKGAGSKHPVTTNFMGFFAPADYWRWAPELDVICDDNYADPNDPESFRTAAFTRDLMRSLKPGKPWLLMEQATNAVNWRHTNAPKAPGQMAALSMQAIGRGSDGIFFFQWRQSRSGSEKFHSAMVPQAGLETRTWRDVVDLGATLPTLPSFETASAGARVAIVLDWESRWALDSPDLPVALDYENLIMRWHAAFHRQQLLVDFVHPEGDLAGYDLVVAPHTYLLTDAAADNLSAYTRGGGTLLVAAFSDVVDENDGFRDGGFTVALRDVLGVAVADFGALVPPAHAVGGSSAGDVGGDAVSPHGPGEDHADLAGPFGTVRGEYFAEEVQLHGASVVASFTSGRMSGAPALTAHEAGAGRAYYLATIPDDAGMKAITGWAAASRGIRPVLDVPSDRVEVSRRGDILTLINHGTDAETVVVSGTDAVTGEAVSRVELEPFGWAMIRTTPVTTGESA